MADDIDQPIDVIDSIYKSMSQIIDTLNTDNILLNKQMVKLQDNVDFLYSSVLSMKEEVTNLKTEVISLKTENTNLKDEVNTLKKYTVDSRTVLLQRIDLLTKDVNKLVKHL